MTVDHLSHMCTIWHPPMRGKAQSRGCLAGWRWPFGSLFKGRQTLLSGCLPFHVTLYLVRAPAYRQLFVGARLPDDGCQIALIMTTRDRQITLLPDDWNDWAY